MTVRFYCQDFSYVEHCRLCEERELSAQGGAGAGSRAEIWKGSPGTESPNWDLFYLSNAGECYKDRRYIFEVFRRHLSSPELSILEVGCGTGSTAFPLLDQLVGQNISYTATDFSPRAVARILEAQQGKPLPVRLKNAFCWDVVESFPKEQLKSSYDVGISVFCLSALRPNAHLQAMKNLFEVLKPGGVLLVRDYAEFDYAQFSKAEMPLGERLFQRKDKTLLYFFSPSYFQHLSTASGYSIVELAVHCVENLNRKTGLATRRCFLHSVLRKPFPSRPEGYYFEAEKLLLRQRHPAPSMFPHLAQKVQLRHLAKLDLWLKGKQGLSQDTSQLPTSLILKGKKRRQELNSWLDTSSNESSWREKLLELEISCGCKEGLALLQQGFPKLQVLNVEGNRVEDIVSVLLPFGKFPSLNSLDLSGNPIDLRHANLLVSYVQEAHQLREIRLRGCSLCSLSGEKTFLRVVRVALESGLAVLDVSEERRISVDGMLQFAELIRSTSSSLEHLYMDNWNVSSNELIAHTLGVAVGSSRRISYLSMEASRLNNSTLVAFCRGMEEGCLSTTVRRVGINLNLNDFNDSSPLHDWLLGTSPVTLRHLSLSGSRLSPHSQILLAGRVACSPWLRSLNLQNCVLTNDFIATLVTRFDINWQRGSFGSLQCLCLSDNNIGCRSVCRLFSLLDKYSCSHPLRVLFMEKALPGEDGLKQIFNFIAASNKRLLCLALSKSEFTLLPEALSTRCISFVPLPPRIKILMIFAFCNKLNSDVLRVIFSFLWVHVRLDLCLVGR